MSSASGSSPSAPSLAMLRPALQSVWMTVLNLPAGDSSRLDDDAADFFDLGGDSLSAGQLLHQLYLQSVVMVTAMQPGTGRPADKERTARPATLSPPGTAAAPAPAVPEASPSFSSLPEPLSFKDVYDAPTIGAMAKLWQTRLEEAVQRQAEESAQAADRAAEAKRAPALPVAALSADADSISSPTAVGASNSKPQLSILRELFGDAALGPADGDAASAAAAAASSPVDAVQLSSVEAPAVPVGAVSRGPLSVAVPPWKLKNDGADGADLDEVAPPAPSLAGPSSVELTPTSGPLSFSQERIWFMEQMFGGGSGSSNSSGPAFTSFHISRLFLLHGALDLSALQLAFTALLARHDQLRTHFTADPKTGRAVQRVLSPGQVALSITFSSLSLSGPQTPAGAAASDAEQEAALAWSAALDSVPFSFDRLPLVRCHVAQLGSSSKRHALFVMFHHIAIDGWSMGTLLHELGVLYRAFHAAAMAPEGDAAQMVDVAALLPALPQWSYIDFAAWHRQLCSPAAPAPLIATQLSYWTDYLSGCEPLALPLDYPRPVQGPPCFLGDVVRVHLSAAQHAQMKALSQSCRSSLFVLLLSALQLLLHKYTQQADIVVGTATAGRHYPGARDVVGCFINPIACRHVFKDLNRLTARGLLEQNQERTMRSLQQQDVPFDQVVRAVEANERQKLMGVIGAAAAGSSPASESPSAGSPVPLSTGPAPAADLSKSPLFQVMLVLQNQNTRRGGLLDLGGECRADLVPHRVQTNKMDLTLVAEERRPTAAASASGAGAGAGASPTGEDGAGGLDLAFEFNTGLFLRQSVVRLSQLFVYLVEQLLSSAERPLCEYTLLSPAERRQLLEEFNGDRRPEGLLQDTTIHALFSAQAARTPNLPAVRLDDKKYTYAKLNQLSNQACNLIRTIFQQHYQTQTDDAAAAAAAQQGANELVHVSPPSSIAAITGEIQPDDLIAICMHPCMELFALILGILKTGAAYVPLDPNYPVERINYMLQDSGAKMLITTTEVLAMLTAPGALSAPGVDLSAAPAAVPAAQPKLDIPIMILEDDWDELREQAVTCAPSAVAKHNLAYVIYTSGSTGAPKGVMVEHYSMCNTARFAVPLMAAGTCMLQFASQSFDAAVAEWSSTFVAGGCLCLTRGKEEKIGQGFLDTVARYAINIAIVSPSVLASIPPCPLPSVQYFICAGEANSELVLRNWRPFVKLMNGYGPTEISVCCSNFMYDDFHPATCIGPPQPNYTCYVLDGDKQLVPIGVNGELYIGGAGVTRGYLNRPELTAERYIPDPFAPEDSPHKRMYRSGDLVRWLPDGTLLYVGRNDHQVKIRGVRIELGEIEHALCQHPKVAQATVIAKEMGARGKQLVAFLVGKKEGPPAAGAAATKEPAASPSSATRRLSASGGGGGGNSLSSGSGTTVNPAVLKSIRKLLATMPVHLRPTYFLSLPALPLNNSAKTDLMALGRIPIGDEHTGLTTQTTGAAGASARNTPQHSPPAGVGSFRAHGQRSASVISTRSPHPSHFGVGGGGGRSGAFSPPHGLHRHRLGSTPTTSMPSTPIHSGVSQNQVSHWRQALLSAWCTVLNRSDIGASENFFEVGGHSLLAAQLHSTFSPELKQHITMLHIFKYPTINSMLAFLKSTAAASASSASASASASPAAGAMGIVGNTPMMQGIAHSGSMLQPLSPRLPSFLSSHSASPSAAGSPANGGLSLQSRHAIMAAHGGASVIGSPPSNVFGTPGSGTRGASNSIDEIASPPESLSVGGGGHFGADEPMAIIGMAGRFPGANSVDAFWSNICGGKESIHFYSEEELEVAGVSPDLLAQPNYVRAMGVLDDVFGFDAQFFHINNREAESMDPQQRIFLETAWTALEDAGYCPSPEQDAEAAAHAPRIGVFAGCGQNTYLNDYCALQFGHLSPAQRHSLMTVNEKDFLCSRISYKLNLRGPAVVVQTACSTSLVAVHMACEALRRGECEMALAGGVSLGMLRPTGYLYQAGMIMSPDGHCRAFDESACGTVRGQGSGAVVLKRLSAALADGDLIYAVLKGSAINNDGSHKVSYSAPSAAGQVEVIRSALWAADVHPRTIGFVEAHGTGTALGDPIELSALTQAYREHTPDQQYAALGSLKTNVGHLDAAAGVAGLIKAALVLHHSTVPPTLHFKRPNPQLDLPHSPFFINTASIAFPPRLRVTARLDLDQLPEGSASAGGDSEDGEEEDADGASDSSSQSGGGDECYPARASVSSFGIGGTNAIAILEAAPLSSESSEEPSLSVSVSGPDAADNDEHPLTLLSWSAVSEAAVRDHAANLAAYLRAHPSVALKDVAYTLHMHRAQFPVRRYVLAASVADALAQLEASSSASASAQQMAAGGSYVATKAASSIISSPRARTRRPASISIQHTMGEQLTGAAAVAQTPLERAILDGSLAKSATAAAGSSGPASAGAGNSANLSGSRGGGQPRSIVFLFPGQGAQFVGMGMELYEHEPVFRSLVQECVAVLRAVLPSQFGSVTIEELWRSEKLAQTQYTQPALFILEYCLAQLLISWGVRPAAMLGHSLGQYVAACVGGVLTLVDCLKAILARSQLMQELVPSGSGAMLSVRMGEEEFLSRYPPASWPLVTIAASNSPVHITLAGPVEAVQRVKEQLGADGAHCTMLATSHAFHSPMLDPMVSSFRTALGQCHMAEPNIPMVCNVTGKWMDPAAVQTPDYWIDHLRNKVCFTQGVKTLLQAATHGRTKAPSAAAAASSKPPTHSHATYSTASTLAAAAAAAAVMSPLAEEPPVRLHNPIFIEVGPGDTCITLLKRHAQMAASMSGAVADPSSRSPSPPSSSSPSTVVPLDLVGGSMALLPKPKAGLVPAHLEKHASLAHLLLKTGDLWLCGVAVQWAQFYARRHARVRLPTYPFQHVHHVIKPESPLMKSMRDSQQRSLNSSPMLRSSSSTPCSPKPNDRTIASTAHRSPSNLSPHPSTGQTQQQLPLPPRRNSSSVVAGEASPLTLPRVPTVPKLTSVEQMSVRMELSPPQTSFNAKRQSPSPKPAETNSHTTPHASAVVAGGATAAPSNGSHPAPAPASHSLQDEIAHSALKVFSMLLGIDAATMSKYDDFFDLGGVLSELRKLYQVDLPGSALMSYPTAAALAKQVAAIIDPEGLREIKNDAAHTNGTHVDSASNSSSSSASPIGGEITSSVADVLSPVREDSASSGKALLSANSSPVSVHGHARRASGAVGAVPGPSPSRPAVITLSGLDCALTLVQAGNVDADSALLPLYMVHPIGGELYYYRDLAPHLGLNRPVYGFRAVSLDGRKAPFTEIQTMASAYVSELLNSRRPRGSPAIVLPSHSGAADLPVISEDEREAFGPIYLGGVSYGGTVAYEMALMLSAMGYKVPLLVLVDAPAPGGLPSRLGDVAGVLEYIAGGHMGVTADELRSLSSAASTDVVTAARKRSSRRLPSYITDSLIATWLAHEKAMFAYESPAPERIAKFTGDVLYFRPSEALKHTHCGMHLPWIELAPQGVRICKVPGNHITMNAKTMIHNWASILRKTLDHLGQ